MLNSDISNELEPSSYIFSAKQTRRHLYGKLVKLVHEIASCEKRAKTIISPNLEEYLKDIEGRRF